jgi:hypothetical protein
MLSDRLCDRSAPESKIDCSRNTHCARSPSRLACSNLDTDGFGPLQSWWYFPLLLAGQIEECRQHYTPGQHEYCPGSEKYALWRKSGFGRCDIRSSSGEIRSELLSSSFSRVEALTRQCMLCIDVTTYICLRFGSHGNRRDDGSPAASISSFVKATKALSTFTAIHASSTAVILSWM